MHINRLIPQYRFKYLHILSTFLYIPCIYKDARLYLYTPVYTIVRLVYIDIYSYIPVIWRVFPCYVIWPGDFPCYVIWHCILRWIKRFSAHLPDKPVCPEDAWVYQAAGSVFQVVRFPGAYNAGLYAYIRGICRLERVSVYTRYMRGAPGNLTTWNTDPAAWYTQASSGNSGLSGRWAEIRLIHVKIHCHMTSW